MRIVQLLAGAPHGGAETAYVDACIAMKEAGHDVIAVTRTHPVRVKKLRDAGVEVYCLPFGTGLDVYTPWALRRIIKRVQPDIVQTWMSRAAQKVRRWSPVMKIAPYVVVSRLGGYYKIKNFHNTDQFVAITPDIQRYLVEDCGVDAVRVSCINNFAETEEVVTPLSRADYGVPEGATLCLGLGRLHESKAFDTLIQAVAQAGDDIYLWIAGEGGDRAALEGLMASLNVGHRVRLLGWRDDRAALFQAADICVFSSRYEPFGTVFVQAWAQKTPLITTAADGPRQYVRDGQDGVVVPIDDVSAMRDAIQKLSHDDMLCHDMVTKGYARYQAEFTRDIMLQSYFTLFASALSTKRGA